MASTASPYGFRAVNELGGLPYAGSTRQFLIDPAGYNTNIYNGSIVGINTATSISSLQMAITAHHSQQAQSAFSSAAPL